MKRRRRTFETDNGNLTDLIRGKNLVYRNVPMKLSESLLVAHSVSKMKSKLSVLFLVIVSAVCVISAPPEVNLINENGIILECDYRIRGCTFYTCDVKNLSVQSKNVESVKVVGEHLDRRTNDVEMIVTIIDQQTKYLPNNLGKLFTNLNGYTISNSGVEEISRKNFEGLTKLATLSIRENLLKELPVDAFYDLHELSMLMLFKNQIETVHPDTFINNPKLNTLYLSFNKLKSLDGSLLRNNLRLQVFSGSNNMLTFIGAGLFDNLTELAQAKFEENPCINQFFWVKDMKLDDLKQIFLKNCQQS